MPRYSSIGRRMTRVLWTLIVFAIATPPLVSEADDSRPNIVFVLTDDQAPWAFGASGDPQALTPNMDRLAARGVLFTNAHCAAPACNPSRAAVFSDIDGDGDLDIAVSNVIAKPTLRHSDYADVEGANHDQLSRRDEAAPGLICRYR